MPIWRIPPYPQQRTAKIIPVVVGEPTPNAYNKLLYTSEPPTPNAWNQLKQEEGTGFRKLLYV